MAKIECQFEPLLVSAEDAAALCGVSRSTWLAWDSAGLIKLRVFFDCPAPIRLNGRTLWSTEQLRQWASTGCKSRDQGQQLREAGNG